MDGPVDAGSSHGKPVLINILEVRVESTAHAIQSGLVRLEGVLKGANVQADKHGSVRLFFDILGGDFGFGEMDDKSEQPPDKVFCLPMNTGFFSMGSEDVMFLEGLILAPTKIVAEYTRLGWFSADGQDSCELIAGGSLIHQEKSHLAQTRAQMTDAVHLVPEPAEEVLQDQLYQHLPTNCFSLV